MKTFEELTEFAKQKEFPDKLTGIERNTVDGIKGIFVQYQGKKINKQEALQAQQEKKRNYENAQTEQMIHRNTCRMRVEMAKVNREMELYGCSLCKRALEIMDERKRTDESQDTAGEPDTQKAETVGGSVCQGAGGTRTRETEL